MPSTINSLVLLLGSASAITAQYLNQSLPFNLVLKSEDLNATGKYLSPCHEGAAIEGLCLSTAPSERDVFRYNYTDTPDYKSPTGYLTWILQGGNFNATEPLQLSYNPTSNVAVPLFSPSESGQPIGFDDDDLLYISGYFDDRVQPLNLSGPAVPYYRWYVCDTYAGYAYRTLAWGLGEAAPQNPSCVKVDVKRKFV
jgi:hypothetical protein